MAKDKEKDKEEKSKDEPKVETEAKKEPTIEDKLQTLDLELQDVKDKYLRALAEMENFKRRNNDELIREKRYSSMPVCDKLIDSIEVFDQAIGMQTEDPTLKNFLIGFKMIKEMMFTVLSDEGVSVIALKVGDKFDPNFAQAVDITSTPDTADNTIVKIIKKGYKYKDRLLRPAMVVINMQPIAPEDKSKTDNAKLDSNIA